MAESKRGKNMGKNRVRKYLSLLVMVTLLISCGYHFNEVSSSLAGIQKVYVANFPNKTVEPYLENYFRNALIDQFIRGNLFQVVNSEEEADAVVEGAILHVSTSHVAYEAADLGAEERVFLSIRIKFEDRKNGRTIWENRNFADTGDRLILKDAYTGDRREEKKKTLIKLSHDMAERAYRFMISDF